MASFEEHIQQAKKNLSFLAATNLNSQSYWDWQVTVCFYVSVHLVNAHIAQVANLHYRTHEDTKNAINPYSQLSTCKVPEDIYLSYGKLENLSRRSRYMCSETRDSSNEAKRTGAKHLARAIRHLDKLIEYFKDLYSIEFIKCKIVCPELSRAEQLKNFEF